MLGPGYTHLHLTPDPLTSVSTPGAPADSSGTPPRAPAAAADGADAWQRLHVCVATQALAQALRPAGAPAAPGGPGPAQPSSSSSVAPPEGGAQRPPLASVPCVPVFVSWEAGYADPRGQAAKLAFKVRSAPGSGRAGGAGGGQVHPASCVCVCCVALRVRAGGAGGVGGAGRAAAVAGGGAVAAGRAGRAGRGGARRGGSGTGRDGGPRAHAAGARVTPLLTSELCAWRGAPCMKTLMRRCVRQSEPRSQPELQPGAQTTQHNVGGFQLPVSAAAFSVRSSWRERGKGAPTVCVHDSTPSS